MADSPSDDSSHSSKQSNRPSGNAGSHAASANVAGVILQQPTVAEPESIWAAAWQGFEEAPTFAAGEPVDSMPGRHRNAVRRRQRSDRDNVLELPHALQLAPAAGLAAGAQPLPDARLALQGLSGGPQLQLLSLALSALEQQLAALPEAARHASEEDWRLLVAALLASCSLAAARAWLGYVPAELQRQASSVISQLTAGLSQPSLELLLRLSRSEPAASSPAGGPAAPSLWPCADRSAVLHAGVVRYLRFGSSTVSAAEAASSQTESPSSHQPQAVALSDVAAAADDLVPTARQLSTRHLARRHLEAGPPGVRGWRHHSLAQAWQGSAAKTGPAVLHDMAVCIAEAVALAYLAEARAGMAGAPVRLELSVMEGCWPVFLQRRLASSRALARFRNQVGFQRWVQSMYRDVVAIYEDRHDVAVVVPGGQLMHKSIPFKRTKELEGLSGWANVLCLLLEMNDVGTPMLRRLFGRISDAVSWLLVTLIGRSLGLIFRGVRQSFNRPAASKSGAQTGGGAAGSSPGMTPGFV